MYGTVDLLVVGLFSDASAVSADYLRSYSIDIVIVGFATPMATVFAIVITAMYGNKSIVRRSACSNGRRAVRL